MRDAGLVPKLARRGLGRRRYLEPTHILRIRISGARRRPRCRKPRVSRTRPPRAPGRGLGLGSGGPHGLEPPALSMATPHPSARCTLASRGTVSCAKAAPGPSPPARSRARSARPRSRSNLASASCRTPSPGLPPAGPEAVRPVLGARGRRCHAPISFWTTSSGNEGGSTAVEHPAADASGPGLASPGPRPAQPRDVERQVNRPLADVMRTEASATTTPGRSA